jgi:hypothetical protein
MRRKRHENCRFLRTKTESFLQKFGEKPGKNAFFRLKKIPQHSEYAAGFGVPIVAGSILEGSYNSQLTIQINCSRFDFRG